MNIISRVFRGLVLCTAAALGAAHAQAPRVQVPAGIQIGASVEGITEYRLGNGLKILLVPDESKPTTTVNMTYLVGSRHENYGETGMAHLLEHLIFKGTPTTPNALAEFSKRGLRANGTTWQDRTNYFASFSANQETLAWYIGWQADAMLNSFIARKDLDTEMTVVRNEMEQGENSAFRILHERMSATAYQWHNYGKTTIGARADVEGVNIDRLQAFYRKYYQPDNAVLTVSGKFDQSKALAAIERSFGKLNRPTRKLDPTYTLEAAQDGERSVAVRRVGNTQMMMAMYHVGPGASADAAAVTLLPFMLGDSPAGRLHKSLVEAKLAASIWGFYWISREPGTITFGAQLPPEQDAAQAREKLLSTIEGFAASSISQAELDRAKANWIKDWELNFTDPEEVGVQLSEYIALGDWRMMFLNRDRVKAVKLEDIQRVAGQFLKRDNRTLGHFIPDAAPARAPKPAFVSADSQVASYKGDPNFKFIPAFDTATKNLDAKTQSATLANGMKLSLISKPTRGDLVSLDITLRIGNEQALNGRGTAGGFAASMLQRGTKALSRQALQDEFDKARATVNIGGSAEQVSASIAVPRAGVEKTIALVADALRNSAFPESEFDDLRRASLTGLQAALKEPEPRGANLLARHGNRFAAGHPRHVQSIEESIASLNALKLEDVRAFHADFYGAANATATAVGDFDVEAIKRALDAGFGNWAAKTRYERIPSPSYVRPVAELSVNLPDKANAYLFARSYFAMQDTSPDYPALLLANYLLGRSESSRLWMRVREKDGLSYDVRSTLGASPYEPSASFDLSAIMAPDNLPKVRKAMAEEIARVLKEGFAEDEVKLGREGLVKLRTLSRAQDGNLARSLGLQAELGRSFAFSGAVDEKIAKLNAAQVSAALRKYFVPGSFFYVSAGSLEKK